MKTKEELNVLKAEVETLNKKLAELTDEELSQVAGGWIWSSDAHYFDLGGPAEPPPVEPTGTSSVIDGSFCPKPIGVCCP